ncbi:MAG: hypothetical protein HQL09_08420 [Nitrospirae bacterium]|nr:hypothetical protein [Nitrospirota bacterium]
MENEKLKLCIWTEGDAGIGMGHVRRCLVIAHEIRKKGMPVHFLVNDNPAVAKWIRQDGFLFSVAPLDETGLPLLDEHGCSLVMMDTKKPVAGLVKALKGSGFKVILMDTVTEARLDADIVIYPTAVFKNNFNWKGFQGKVFYGAEYVPIAESFRESRQRYGEKVLDPPYRILVTMGGSDPNHLTYKVVSALRGWDGPVIIKVVIGPSFSPDENLEILEAEKDLNIEFIRNIEDLSLLMAESHIAITALGTTLYELAYLGVPSVIIANYKNDESDMEAFKKLGIAFPLGYYKDVKVEDIRSAVEELLGNRDLYKEMSRKGNTLINGHGSERIVDIIRQMTKGKEEMGSEGVVV